MDIAGILRSNKGIKGSKAIGNILLRKVSTTAQDIDEGEATGANVRVDTKGQAVQALPHYYSSYIAAELNSTNVFNSILKYAHAAERNSMFEDQMKGPSVLQINRAAVSVMENNVPVKDTNDTIWGQVYKNTNQSFRNYLGLKGAGKTKNASSDNERLRTVVELRKCGFTERKTATRLT